MRRTVKLPLPFVFDASGLTSAADIVVFESLYRDDVEIAVHADIEDKGQTVKITPPVLMYRKPVMTQISAFGSDSVQ